MQAILLAAADNEKLGPLTASTPSPLLAVGNRPVMEIVLEQLARAGIKKIIICLHRMAGEIELYFGTGSRWGVALEYVLMREAWGTAGSLGWAKSLLSETFIVMPSDEIIDLDIPEALELHRQNRHRATVVLHKNKNQAERIGMMGGESDAESGVASDESFAGNPSGTTISAILAEQWCSETGAYIFEPEVLNWIPARKKYDISTHLLPALSEAGLPVGAYITEGYWNPLDSFCEFQDAQQTLLYSLWRKSPLPHQEFLSNYSQLVGKEIKSGVWMGRNTVIHPSAQLVPPVLLGENIRVGQGVILGPEVVVGTGSIISERASIHSSTIFEHTFIGQLLHIEDRLVCKGLVVDTNSSQYIHISDPILLGETPRSVPASLLNRSLDMAMAGLLLLLAAPLFVIIGVISWLSFGGVFQRMPRLKGMAASPEGEQTVDELTTEKVFNVIHFRTRGEANRTTWFSRWLERLEWNRLPELYNVLIGNMRLIGAKPLATDETGDLTELWQDSKVELTPGFTGLWYVQTSPWDGPEETLVSGVANVYYHATQSLRQDAQILMRTPLAWLKRIKKREFKGESLREG